MSLFSNINSIGIPGVFNPFGSLEGTAGGSPSGNGTASGNGTTSGGTTTSGGASTSGGTTTSASSDTKADERAATWARINADIEDANAFMRIPFASVQAKFAAAMIKFAAQGLREVQFKKEEVDARMEESKLRKELSNKLTELENLLSTANYNGAIKDIKDTNLRNRCLQLAADINTQGLQLGYCQRMGSDGKPVPLPAGVAPPDEAENGLVDDEKSIGGAWPNERAKANADFWAKEALTSNEMIAEMARFDPMGSFLPIIAEQVYGSPIDLGNHANLETFMAAYDANKARIEAGPDPVKKSAVAWFDARIKTVYDNAYSKEMENFTVKVSNGIAGTSTIAQIRSAHTRVDNDVRTDSDYLSQDMQALSSESGRYDSVISMAKNFLESLARDLSGIVSKMF